MRSLTPILLIVISIGLFYLHIDPSYAGVKELISQEEQYSDALDRAKDLELKRDEFLTTYNSFSQDNLRRLQKIVPDKINTVKFVTDIDAIGGKHGITIKSIRVTEEVVDSAQEITLDPLLIKPYQTTTISFNFSTRYENLVSFLKDLEKSLQMVDIKSVSFQVADEGVNNGIHEYEVSIQTYWLK